MTPDFNFNFLSPEVLRPEMQAFGSGFLTTLIHSGITLALLLVGATIYSLLTPYKEIDQIREGNNAAAVGFGGVIIGLAIPLAASMAASHEPKRLWTAETNEPRKLRVSSGRPASTALSSSAKIFS